VEDSQGRDGGSKNATHSCLERDALKLITVLLILQLILLICWTAIDPLRWERNYINDDPTNTYGSCSGGTISTVFLVFIIALDFSALALACERAYRSRNIDDQFSESRYVVSSTLVQILNIFGTMAQPVSVSSLLVFGVLILDPAPCVGCPDNVYHQGQSYGILLHKSDDHIFSMRINAFVHVCAKDEAHGTPASMSTNNSLLSRNSTKQTRGTVEEQEVRVVLHCIRGVNVTIKNT
jgi:hypothetical protein